MPSLSEQHFADKVTQVHELYGLRIIFVEGTEIMALTTPDLRLIGGLVLEPSDAEDPSGTIDRLTGWFSYLSRGLTGWM